MVSVILGHSRRFDVCSCVMFSAKFDCNQLFDAIKMTVAAFKTAAVVKECETLIRFYSKPLNKSLPLSPHFHTRIFSFSVKDDADGLLRIAICCRRVCYLQDPLHRLLPLRCPHGRGKESMYRQWHERHDDLHLCNQRVQWERSGFSCQGTKWIAQSQRRVRERRGNKLQEDWLVSLCPIAPFHL